ncbi:MAG: RsmB/NOP family class I SAM-dependent RNA methyltransferase [Verrucomicrobiales bacterium]
MRQRLKADKLLSPFEKREVALGVFDYFRWLGWLNPANSMENQVSEAMELADAFKRDRSFISNEELTKRAVPEWVHEFAQLTPEILRQFQAQPALWLRCRSDAVEQVRAAFPGSQVHPQLRTALHYSGDDDLFRSELFHNGAFEIQDISSQWVGWFTGAKAGTTWWDACAGEGGKTLHLADLMQNKGLLWATDPAEWRLERLKKRASRAKVFNFRSRLWKAGQTLPFKTKLDGIIVDAPCSGIGTWQRNPQARWTARPEDVIELAEIQKQILNQVHTLLKPGGLLVYSVCTLAEKETSEVAASFVEQQLNFERTSQTLTSPKDGTAPIGARILNENEVWLLPHLVNGNGMYCAAWVKKS